MSVRTLIVDDAPFLRELLRLQFEGSQYHVVGEASDGAEAILKAAELQPDVVILDLGMPVMDGLAALPLIRSAAPGTKVVCLTGSEERYRQEAVRLGASKVLDKNDLTTIVEQLGV